MRARLFAELATLPKSPDPDAIAALPYLGAVCSETLRINPVAPLIGRTLEKELTLKGFTLQPGLSVGVAIVNLHRDPALYPDPDSFRPERFLDRTYGPFEYLPFGGGARRCLGAALAAYEMKLVLATILKNHQLRLAHGRPARARVRNTTVGPTRIEMLRAWPGSPRSPVN